MGEPSRRTEDRGRKTDLAIVKRLKVIRVKV